MTDFDLTDGERNHPLWLRLKAHWLGQLDVLRKRNDSATMTEPETAALRGHIKCLKGVIALGDVLPKIE